CRQHTGIGVEEIAEVIVSRVLTPKHCAMFGHIGLNKRVSDPGFYGPTACVLHNFGYHSGGNQVVDNYGGVLTGLFGPSDLADSGLQIHEVRGLNGISRVVWKRAV